MKKTLVEELERIHSITYGKKVLEEQNLLDRIFSAVGLKDDEEKKKDDPKKADLVSSDVEEFFNTLKKASEGDGISQQERGSMNFQKEVESMQIGLVHLGYELPKHGVDGLFGPETAAAVTKFETENLGEDKKSVNEAVKLVSQGGGLIGKPGQGTHNASDWQSGNAWDVTGPVGAEVYSITSGVVNKVKKASGGLVKSGVKKIYGDQISVKSNDGKPDVFYTHIDSLVSQGDSVKEGDVIGKIMQIDGIPSHVHVGVSSGNLSDLATGLSNATGGKTGGNTILKVATPKMLNKLIEMLRDKGIKSEDLKKYIDPVLTGGGVGFTDLDLTKPEDVEKYAEICQKFINTKQPNPLGITGEMLAKGAVQAFERYKKFVPAELALAQLVVEGGIGNGNPNIRPVRTKNPFNVGNTDSGANEYQDSVQDGINRYYNLIAKSYLGKGKTANDLISNFVNQSGNRYASAGNYESALSKQVSIANKIAQQSIA